MNPEVEALKNRGNAHFQKGKYLDAIDCYTAATIIDPKHVISLGNRSACYLGKFVMMSPMYVPCFGFNWWF